MVFGWRSCIAYDCFCRALHHWDSVIDLHWIYWNIRNYSGFKNLQNEQYLWRTWYDESNCEETASEIYQSKQQACFYDMIAVDS